jgi:two-component system chemotaxis response regulator CheY
MDKRHILVVDDDPAIRLALVLKFENEGYRVSTASDGVDALDFMAQNPVDLVVLDIGMPRMDGYAVARSMRDQEATRDVPLLVLTAQNLEAPDDVHAAMGRHRFLTKPFSPREMVRIIAELLQGE